MTVSFGGSDATSGIATCTRAGALQGPRRRRRGGERVVHRRRGQLGRDDVTRSSTTRRRRSCRSRGPSREAASSASLVAGVQDVASTQLVRTPGLKGAQAASSTRGKAAAFVDKTVRPGVRYRYQVVVGDVAGNLSGRVVTAVSRAALYRPAAGGKVRAPPARAGRRSAGATFYNVQLYRNGVKMHERLAAAGGLRRAAGHGGTRASGTRSSRAATSGTSGRQGHACAAAVRPRHSASSFVVRGGSRRGHAKTVRTERIVTAAVRVRHDRLCARVGLSCASFSPAYR